MHLTVEEKEYLDLFEAKEYKPELLFSDDQILRNIGKTRRISTMIKILFICHGRMHTNP